MLTTSSRLSTTETISLRTKIESAGWRSLDERLWDRLDGLSQGVVLLAPPLDTIPSPNGNAIYVLVEEIASRLPVPVLVLARWPETGVPACSRISDRILYDTNPWKPGWLERHAPYRLKRYLTGSGAPYYYAYARRAANVCRWLSAGRIVIEDVPVFTIPFRKRNPAALIFLHQHNTSSRSISPHYWHKVVFGLHGVIFVSETTKRITENMHGDLPVPATVVYNGVDLTQYDPVRWQPEAGRLRQELGIRPHDKTLFFIGRIVPAKGIAEAAEAFNRAGLDGAHFVVVGDLENSLYSDAAYTQRLRRAAEGSNGKIHLVGPKPQSIVPAFYVASDVVILPSIGNEGLPKVVTEALAMGKPCLVSDRGGMLELIRENINGWVIPDPANIPDLASKILFALQHSETVHIDRSLVDAQRMAIEFQRAIGLGGE